MPGSGPRSAITTALPDSTRVAAALLALGAVIDLGVAAAAAPAWGLLGAVDPAWSSGARLARATLGFGIPLAIGFALATSGFVAAVGLRRGQPWAWILANGLALLHVPALVGAACLGALWQEDTRAWAAPRLPPPEKQAPEGLGAAGSPSPGPDPAG